MRNIADLQRAIEQNVPEARRATLFLRDSFWWVSVGSGPRRLRRSTGIMAHQRELADILLGDLNRWLQLRAAGVAEAAEPALSLEDVFSRYLETVKVNCAPRSLVRYQQHRDHFLAFCAAQGLRMAQDVTPHHVEQFKGARLKAGARTATVNRDLTFLKSAFLYSLGRNPFRAVKPLKVRDSKDIRFLSLEEGQRLVAAARPRFRAYLVGYLSLGVRKTELTALRREDLDFERHRVRITNLKTFRSAKDKYRYLPMGPDLEAFLREREDWPRPFPPYSPNALRLALIATARRAGIKGLTRLHDLRHTWASWMAKAGMPEGLLAQALGHSRNSTATRIYIHFMPEDAGPYVRLIDLKSQSGGEK